MRKVVGIDRKIKRAWLDGLLDRLVQTTDGDELRIFLDERLRKELPGTNSRKNSVGIALRIWSGIPQERLALRDRAVALLPRIPGQERIWLHWGMTALAYPFFRDTAEVVGRLLGLQDDITTAQVQSRLLTAWGDKATSKEAAQKLLTTLVDWEVLRPTKGKGHFVPSRKMTASTPDLQLWLVEALLGANEAEEIEAQQLLRLPELFPFTLNIGVGDLRKHEGFNIHRQGLDMDMVALRKVREEQPPKPAKKPRRKAAKPIQPGLFDQQVEEVAVVNGQKWTLADMPFAAPIAECTNLVREGHFYAGIALAQAVVESVVLLIWRVKVRKRKNQKMDFVKALAALHKNSLIVEECKSRIERMWTDRHAILQYRLCVESDMHLLEETAWSSLGLLNELARELFGYSQQEGVVIPDHPEYWLNPESEMRDSRA